MMVFLVSVFVHACAILAMAMVQWWWCRSRNPSTAASIGHMGATAQPGEDETGPALNEPDPETETGERPDSVNARIMTLAGTRDYQPPFLPPSLTNTEARNHVMDSPDTSDLWEMPSPNGRNSKMIRPRHQSRESVRGTLQHGALRNRQAGVNPASE